MVALDLWRSADASRLHVDGVRCPRDNVRHGMHARRRAKYLCDVAAEVRTVLRATLLGIARHIGQTVPAHAGIRHRPVYVPIRAHPDDGHHDDRRILRYETCDRMDLPLVDHRVFGSQLSVCVVPYGT